MAKAVKAQTRKKTPDSRVMKSAAALGAALGRAAKRVDRLKKAVSKKGAAKRARKARTDPAKAAQRSKTREEWKDRERTSTVVDLAQQGAVVDERARVRSVTGRSWANRKPR